MASPAICIVDSEDRQNEEMCMPALNNYCSWLRLLSAAPLILPCTPHRFFFITILIKNNITRLKHVSALMIQLRTKY